MVLLRRNAVQNTVLPNHNGGFSELKLLLDNDDQAITIGKQGKDLVSIYNHSVTKLIQKTTYDWSVARDKQGWIYVLAYTYDQRSFLVTVSRGDLKDWRLKMVDSSEAGWNHSISMWEDQVVIAYYYYRNSFNKGLRLSYLIYKRFYAMHGTGLFFRVGYGAQGLAHGFRAGPPGDRDEDERDESDSVTRAHHYQVQHGPFLNLGLVY